MPVEAGGQVLTNAGHSSTVRSMYETRDTSDGHGVGRLPVGEWKLEWLVTEADEVSG
jgi:hypothetical protein